MELKKNISNLAFVLISVLAFTLFSSSISVQGATLTYSNPVFANGLVYVGSSDGYIYALNASSGEGVWTRELSIGGPQDLGALAASNNVVVCTVNWKLAALNASTGQPLWVGGTNGVMSNPIMAGGDHLSLPVET